jgi:pyruvate dehydrogenase E1 component alpha subunit
MPRTRVYEAVTERLAILELDGSVDQALMPGFDGEQVLAMYRDMVRMRAFDDKALKLQRQGRMGTWPPIRGQEAVQVGVGHAMTEADWLIPAFREHGVMLLKGVPGHLLYAFWAGDERGSCFPEGVRCFPVAVPVGSQWQHGAGVGLSLKLRGEAAAAVTFGGDGSTGRPWVAGVFQVPVRHQNKRGDLDPAPPPDRLSDARAEGARLRHPGPPGGRQRRVRGLGRRRRGPRACQERGRADVDRGGDLPDRRSHHGRRRQPLPQRRGGRVVAGARSDHEAATLPRDPRPVGRRPRV